MILKNNKRIDGVSLDTTPIGALFAFTGLTAPNGYLLCQGQLVSKTRYAALYAICGDTFGTSTSTEFYLPDLRGKTITGYKENDSTFGTLGALIGALTHAHNYAHTHGIPGVAHNHGTSSMSACIGSPLSNADALGFAAVNVSGPTSTYSVPGSGGSSASGHPNRSHNTAITGTTDNATPSSTTTNSQSTSTSGTASSLQPSLNLNWVIKAEMINYTSSQVYDGLDSTSTINSLSAKQGKVLNDKFASYLPLTGGTITGDFVLQGREHSDVGNVYHVNGDLDGNGYFTVGLQCINNALKFDWYDSRWEIGNIRSNGENSQGYGLTYSEDDSTPKLCLYVDTDGYTHGRFMNYSTTEQIIGKWIDGKPIYRKIGSFTLASTIPADNVVATITNISTLVDLKATVNTSTNKVVLPISWNETLDAGIIMQGDNIVVRSTWDIFSGASGYYMIEYTKTTD